LIFEESNLKRHTVKSYSVTNMTSSIVGQRYQISKRIGGGSFGEIFLGIGPNNEKVVLCINKLFII
jgi:hypothetical protein